MGRLKRPGGEHIGRVLPSFALSILDSVRARMSTLTELQNDAGTQAPVAYTWALAEPSCFRRTINACSSSLFAHHLDVSSKRAAPSRLGGSAASIPVNIVSFRRGYVSQSISGCL